MILVGECKRSNLGSGSITQRVIKRKIAEHSSSGGFLYHNVIRRNGLAWLVSGTTEGIPLVESVIRSQSVTRPFIVFYRAPANVLLMAYVHGDKLDSIVETRISSATDVIVNKALSVINGDKGLVFIIDDAMHSDSFAVIPKVLRTTELLTNTKMLLSAGDNHKAPMTVQQIFAIVLGVMVVISFVLFIVSDEKEKEVKKEARDEFVQFENGLEKRGAVKAMTYQLYKDLLFINHLIGWKASTITINEEIVYIEVDKDPVGRLDSLFDIVSKTGRSVSQFSENKATIVSQHQALPTLSEAVFVPIEDLQIYIGFAQDDWLSGERTKLKFNKVKSQKSHSEMEFEWDAEGYFKDDLDVMGTLLNMIPVVFNRATLTLNNDETFSGKFTFTILGCEKTKCEEVK
jgi:hypothetical protein